jgi:hypothetical protein
MVEPPKKPLPRSRPTLHDLKVLLETMRGEYRAVGEDLQSFREEFQSFRKDVDARFDRVNTRFDQVDARFDQVDGRFGQVDGRFDQVDGRLGRVEHDIVLLKDAVVENTRELKHLRVVVDKKVDRDEIEPIVEGILCRRG